MIYFFLTVDCCFLLKNFLLETLFDALDLLLLFNTFWSFSLGFLQVSAWLRKPAWTCFTGDDDSRSFKLLIKDWLWVLLLKAMNRDLLFKTFCCCLDFANADLELFKSLVVELESSSLSSLVALEHVEQLEHEPDSEERDSLESDSLESESSDSSSDSFWKVLFLERFELGGSMVAQFSGMVIKGSLLGRSYRSGDLWMKKTQLETHFLKFILDLLLWHRHRWLRRQTRLELKVQPRSSSTTRLKGAEAAHPETKTKFSFKFHGFWRVV